MKNWLQNPGFEGIYQAQDGINEVKVAIGWRAFWHEGLPPQEHAQGPCQRPEYIPATLGVDAGRVIEGARAQGWFLRYKVMDAGVYQRIMDLSVDEPFSFSVYAHAWCSNRDDPRAADGEMYLALGVDLTGGTDARAIHVRWTEWRRLTQDYRELTIADRTTGPELTVFVRAWNKWRLSHNDVYIDDASFTVEGGQEPDPDPEPGACRVVFMDGNGEWDRIEFSDQAEYSVSAQGTLVEFRDGGRLFLVPVDRLVLASLSTEPNPGGVLVRRG